MKKNHAGKHCSNPQCFKEKKYKTQFSTSSLLKNKINKNNSEKKHKKLKKQKKKILGKKSKKK